MAAHERQFEQGQVLTPEPAPGMMLIAGYDGSMATPHEPSLRCVLLGYGPGFERLRSAAQAAAEESGFQLVFIDDATPTSGPQAALVESLKADLIVADVSNESPNVFYEAGLAHGLGKPVVFLVNEGARASAFRNWFFTAQPYRVLFYNLASSAGTQLLLSGLRAAFQDFRREPGRFPVFPRPSSARGLPPMVDLERLEPREFENLCFELLTQMGFRRVEWGEGLPELDLIATLPRKDPDGFEYHELWLISMGFHAPLEMLLEVATHEPEHLCRPLLRPGVLGTSRISLRPETPVTLLLIPFRGDTRDDVLRRRLQRFEERSVERRSAYALRVRLWDAPQLRGLIQQYPQLAYKYFSEEARSQSKHRKSADELYRENVELTERLQATIVALKRAERDAVWKDVAFKAAHKLGNPIFALETNLQSIKGRVVDHPGEALTVAREMESSIEKAKAIIEQFKSLTRAQEITVRPLDLVPLIRAASHLPEAKGVRVDIVAPEKPILALADPVRMAECFDELFANALHWLDKTEKRIEVEIDTPKEEDLAFPLKEGRQYARVLFRDNGSGVPLDKKEQIFEAFYTTYTHGTGLGLSLVQRVIEGHGGLIRETGRPGDGAAFEIYLPRAPQ